MFENFEEEKSIESLNHLLLAAYQLKLYQMEIAGDKLKYKPLNIEIKRSLQTTVKFISDLPLFLFMPSFSLFYLISSYFVSCYLSAMVHFYMVSALFTDISPFFQSPLGRVITTRTIGPDSIVKIAWTFQSRAFSEDCTGNRKYTNLVQRTQSSKAHPIFTNEIRTNSRRSLN